MLRLCNQAYLNKNNTQMRTCFSGALLSGALGLSVAAMLARYARMRGGSRKLHYNNHSTHRHFIGS